MSNTLPCTADDSVFPIIQGRCSNLPAVSNTLPCTADHSKVKDEINVPIAFSAFRDKSSRLWSFKKCFIIFLTIVLPDYTGKVLESVSDVHHTALHGTPQCLPDYTGKGLGLPSGVQRMCRADSAD